MDFILFQLINNLSGRWTALDLVGIFCAKYLIFIMVFVAACLLIVYKDTMQKKIHQQAAMKAFVSVLFGYALNTLLQIFFSRPRPFVSHNIFPLIDGPNAFSFPSGHTTMAFALALSLYFYNKKLGAIFLVFAALVGLGRVFVGVHYPFDVFGGVLLGAFSAFVVERFFKVLVARH